MESTKCIYRQHKNCQQDYRLARNINIFSIVYLTGSSSIGRQPHSICRQILEEFEIIDTETIQSKVNRLMSLLLIK